MEANYQGARLKVGCFFGLALSVLVGLLFWLSGGDTSAFGVARDSYFVEFDDVTGLRKNAVVMLAGTQIGEVAGMELAGARTRVEMRIERRPSIKIYADAVWTLTQPSIIGLPWITVTPGSPAAGLVSWMPEDTVEIAVDKRQKREFPVTSTRQTAAMNTLMAQSSDTIKIVNKVLEDFHARQAALMDQAERLMKSTADITHALSESLDQARLEAISKNIERITDDVAGMLTENRQKVSQLMDNFNTALTTGREELLKRSDDMGKLLTASTTAIDKTLTPLVQRLTDLTTTLDRLMKDNAHNLGETVVNIRTATDNLAGFTARIKANPSLLIFGDDEQKNVAQHQRNQMQMDLRDHGRMPIYEKRSDGK